MEKREELSAGTSRGVTLEICAGNIESVVAAAEGGAQRIELCTDLASGGTTPSHGLIAAAVDVLGKYSVQSGKMRLKLMVMIRPRLGSFIYGPLEFKIMRHDIRASRSLGADGVVIGCLRENERGERVIDVDATTDLLKVVEEERWAAGNSGDVTFHRAFDDCHNRRQAFEDICESFAGRIQRILTSGGCASAIDGLPELKDLSDRANKLLQLPRIMPGSGVTAENALQVVRSTGVSEIHASAKEIMADPGSVSPLFETSGLVSTDVEKVKAIVEQLSSNTFAG